MNQPVASILLTDQIERHFAQIVSIAADAIICIDRDQRITLFNQGAVQAFGYTSEEALGMKLDELVPGRFRGGHARHVEGFAAGPAGARTMRERGVIHALRKNGSEFPAEATISKAGNGPDAVMTVILRDVTQRVLAQEQLERMVAERTRELEAEIRRREEAQEQLVRTQRLEAVGQLTGGLAHDFNNLLTVIGGNLELLRDKIRDGRQLRQLDRALDAVQMGARLTQRLLSFARRNRLEPELLDINSEILTLIDLLRRTLGESITITSTLSPDLWSVKADSSQIENAVLNLAINARDAMPEGGRLIIETANASIDSSFPVLTRGERVLPGDYVRITISDTGSGMTQEVVARAFEPFFTTKEPGKGTGLGLASIYGFARQSGGYVTIYSEPGKGTTVNVYLPSASHGASPVRHAERTFERSAPVTGRILVVEDNPDVRETTVERLATLGYEAISCGGVADAIEHLQGGGAFALVFSDVVMPGGQSGLDLAAWIKDNRPTLPVLLTSGFADDVIRPDIVTPSPPLLRKPYGLADLGEAIRRLTAHP
jgi:PAS domain S-box-containing protein